MESQVTVRIPEDLRTALEAASKKLNVKVSDIVRMALNEFLGSSEASKSRSAERVRGLIGSLESGIPDLAENHRAYILESLKNGE